MGEGAELTRIINGCKSGDADSFAQMVDIYAGRCYGYFYRLTGDPDLSEELLSRLFMKLFEKIESHKGGAFESWLFRIAANIFHDYLRAKQRRNKLLDGWRTKLELVRTGSPRSDETDETLDRLQVQFARLDSDTRELIALRFFSELSFKEIAEVRSEPIGTVLSKLHRGLKKLRKLMEG